MKIAFILPTYNDEKNLKKLILRIKDYLKNLDCKLYFFIINDGSSNEFNIVNEIENSTQINLKNNEGNQKAISIGLMHLRELEEKFEYTFIMDSDGEDDPKYLSELLTKTKQAENQKIIFASRLRRNEGIIFNLFFFFLQNYFLCFNWSKNKFWKF